MNGQLRYQGLWRRDYLRDAHGTDTETEVHWLQGGHYYVDLRLPTGRPAFGPDTTLDALTDAQARWLAMVEGFCGRLDVADDVLTWHRQIDYQPPARLGDVGRMRQVGEGFIETGVLQSYEEGWQRSPLGGAGVTVRQLEHGAARGLAVTAGHWHMQCVDRRPALPPGERLEALLTAGYAAPPALLDCCIDLAQRDPDGGHWRIVRSSHPWREGTTLNIAENTRGPAWRDVTATETDTQPEEDTHV
jgi:hypothetical protein